MSDCLLQRSKLWSIGFENFGLKNCLGFFLFIIIYYFRLKISDVLFVSALRSFVIKNAVIERHDNNVLKYFVAS